MPRSELHHIAGRRGVPGLRRGRRRAAAGGLAARPRGPGRDRSLHRDRAGPRRRQPDVGREAGRSRARSRRQGGRRRRHDHRHRRSAPGPREPPVPRERHGDPRLVARLRGDDPPRRRARRPEDRRLVRGRHPRRQGRPAPHRRRPRGPGEGRARPRARRSATRPIPTRRAGSRSSSGPGQSDMMSDVTDELIEAAARDAEHLELIRALGLRSYMCVPILAGGQVLGAITLRRGRIRAGTSRPTTWPSPRASRRGPRRRSRTPARSGRPFATSASSTRRSMRSSCSIRSRCALSYVEPGRDRPARLQRGRPARRRTRRRSSRTSTRSGCAASSRRSSAAPSTRAPRRSRSATAMAARSRSRSCSSTSRRPARPAGSWPSPATSATGSRPRRTSGALAESEHARAAELNAVIRAMGDGIFVCTGDGQISLANPAAEDLFPDVEEQTYADILAQLEDPDGDGARARHDWRPGRAAGSRRRRALDRAEHLPGRPGARARRATRTRRS